MTTYRTGNKNARNIYRVDGDGTEEHIGCMFTEEDGKAVVKAMTTASKLVSENRFMRERIDRDRARVDEVKALRRRLSIAAALLNPDAECTSCGRSDCPTAGFTGSCPRCGLRDAEGDDGTLCAPCDTEVSTEDQPAPEPEFDTGDWAPGDWVEYDAYGKRFDTVLIRPDGGQCWLAVVVSGAGQWVDDGRLRIGERVSVVYGHSKKIEPRPGYKTYENGLGTHSLPEDAARLLAIDATGMVTGPPVGAVQSVAARLSVWQVPGDIRPKPEGETP